MAKKKPAKKAEKEKTSKISIKTKYKKLEGFAFEYAQKMKFTRNLQFMLMEFVMLALGLSGESKDDKTYARETIKNIKRKVK